MDLSTVLKLDTIQIVFVIIVAILIANYVYMRWAIYSKRVIDMDIDEGFASAGNDEKNSSDMVVLGNEHLYDAFYAKVYDQVVDGKQRTDAEVNLTLGWAHTFRPENKLIQVLDIGCGTGGAVNAFRRAGVSKVVGVDASDAMISRGRVLYPKADLRVGEAETIGQFAAGEFNLITLYYFTYYYLRDREQVFKNMFNWLQPGGCLVIHLVNREKFDPILESASPFVGFSVQKYAKDRVTRSRVEFDKFSYEANFELDGDAAEFQEEFRFKDGKRRRQIHHLRMPTMAEIVSVAEANGFVYKQVIDMTAFGYEYQYLYCFVR